MLRSLHMSGVLAEDYSTTLETLNGARKVAVYEGEPPDFEETSLEDLLADVETAVDAAAEASK